ncbi:U4/U6-U5 snRNP complex subunit SNU23 [Sporobolomyces koalae]|uniref:U4/U6-U5 snRNP complex subunit SNU23 n=1 Tax=Sporobolomyces koalae TaxID=500713 RepID=UPI0031763A0F
MVGAYGANSKSDTNFRKEWNQEEYEERARAKDKEAHEHALLVEEYAKKGKKPPRRKNPGDDIPKPTSALQAREQPLDLSKNLNKTIIVDVSSSSGGQKGPGFYCDVCKRTCKDSARYLDHINGRSHLRRLGQTTKVKRTTLDDVRQKISELRARTAQASEKKAYDFAQRIREIKAEEIKEREEMKEAKRRKKEQDKLEERKQLEQGVDQGMMDMMGFAGFGGGVRAK